ncbi:hypothetical protein FQR65_LT06361 [Abscondita terminalis]|nr:hypothetical protein FQR65_LT06361 [Abscondita terminalis]
MMSVIIYKLEVDKVPIANLKEGVHPFGRGALLECDDRRVSRNHGIIEITNNAVTIASTHQNPCFYQTADSKTITILPKHSPVSLNDGDKFALLADQFWYRVKIEKSEIAGNNIDEVLNDHNESNKSTHNGDTEITKRNYESDDGDNLQNKKIKLNDEPSPANVTEEHVISETPSASKTNVPFTAEDAKLKAMLFSSDEEDNQIPPLSLPQTDETGKSAETKDVAENPDNKAGTSKTNVKRQWRDYCIYGAECYRKNQAHFIEYSHPGDSDYESDPNDDRPACSFGSQCYRTNKDHRKGYKHPRGGNIPKPPKNKQKPTPKKRTNNVNYVQESSEDDYDMDDPFMADSGSEFEIDSVSEDDTDSDLSDAAEEEETKRLVKESRWKSVTAKGKYPTIKPFNYCEEMEFASIGQPMLNYKSVTWHPEEKRPMHLESGHLRINLTSCGEVALLVSHNFGLTSVEEGTVNGYTMNVKTTGISRMKFCKDPAVTAIARTYQFCPDTNKLHLIVCMSTVTTPELTEHLKIEYEKICN